MPYRCDNHDDRGAAAVIQITETAEVMTLCDECVGPWALGLGASSALAQGLDLVQIFQMVLEQHNLPYALVGVELPETADVAPRAAKKGARRASSNHTTTTHPEDGGGDAGPAGGPASVPDPTVVAVDTRPVDGGDHPAVD